MNCINCKKNYINYEDNLCIRDTGYCIKCFMAKEVKVVKLSKSRDPELMDSLDTHKIQNIGELWESLAKYAQGRCEDNKRYGGKYPINTRKSQMASLHSLVSAITDFHERWEISPNAFRGVEECSRGTESEE